MLRLYMRDEELPQFRQRVIRDIEYEFSTIILGKSEAERNILKSIEDAEVYDEMSFIDRFHDKLNISELSAGAKAALCVLNRPECVVDTIECGINAIASIILNCDNGTVIITDFQTYLPNLDMPDKKINVQLDNYRFDNLDRLNRYICEERPYTPEMIGGIYNV